MDGERSALNDQLVLFIRLNLRAILARFVAIAAIAWATGPDARPTAVRDFLRRSLDSFRQGSDVNSRPTPVAGFLQRNRSVLRGGIIGAALLGYVMTEHPTGARTLGLVGAALVLLVVTELLGRRTARPG